jgi:adenine-specific DNA methylase
VSIERDFDAVFATRLALREKQIQQNYRPIIGIHKWFARRPGTLFRSLLLAEYNGSESLDTSYWRAHDLRGVIADPFMGGGTIIFEANRLGFSTIGADINPMAYWIVRQALAPIDREEYLNAAERVVRQVEAQVGRLYQTRCKKCRHTAQVKYFIWVKTERCPFCLSVNDLFPGYLLAEAVRHPRHVVVCRSCGHLNEYENAPKRAASSRCAECREKVFVEGPAHRQEIECRECGKRFRFPQRPLIPRPPPHRLWAIEYHCDRCKRSHQGRFFKKPDRQDLARFAECARILRERPDLRIPEDEIPPGDETNRLHRWGYRRYREMFNERQLLGLGLLLVEIVAVQSVAARHALLTVFSDFLRYQNMLCRYDTYALKCQDIFSVHGFPVGLVQCENSLLGIPRVGSGSFRHFVEKYLRAKDYCALPFETRFEKSKKRIIPVEGERIEARVTGSLPEVTKPRRAFLQAGPATTVDFQNVCLDGVFTDPPYFDNVQYAELMDFCFVWLRLGLHEDHDEFRAVSTRHAEELTGNVTLARGLESFAEGLSRVFRRYASALKPAAPFVFTYHHNDPFAYLPIVVAVLDADLDCTSTLPAAAEMGASLHIAGTGSSVLDSVFVCRSSTAPERTAPESLERLKRSEPSAFRVSIRLPIFSYRLKRLLRPSSRRR